MQATNSNMPDTPDTRTDEEFIFSYELSENVRSPNPEIRRKQVSRINYSRRDLFITLVDAIRTLSEDDNESVLQELYNGMAKMYRKIPRVRNVIINLLANVISKHSSMCKQEAEEALAVIIKKHSDALNIFAKTVEDEPILKVRIAMTEYILVFLPDFFPKKIPNIKKSIEDIYNECFLEIFKINKGTENLLAVLENMDITFVFYEFVDQIFKWYQESKVDESGVIHYLFFKNQLTEIEQVSCSLSKFLDIVKPEMFHYTIQQIKDRFWKSIYIKTMQKFTKDVIRRTSVCDEEKFLLKMHLISKKVDDEMFFRCLLGRIEILNSTCDVMRTRFALTLLKAVQQLKSYRSYSSKIILQIAMYAANVIPLNLDRTPVSLQNIEIAIRLIHYFINDKLFTRKWKAPTHEVQLNKRLEYLRGTLKWYTSTETGKADITAKKIIRKVDAILEKKKTYINRKPSSENRHKYVRAEDAKLYMSQKPNVLIGILCYADWLEPKWDHLYWKSQM